MLAPQLELWTSLSTIRKPWKNRKATIAIIGVKATLKMSFVLTTTFNAVIATIVVHKLMITDNKIDKSIKVPLRICVIIKVLCGVTITKWIRTIIVIVKPNKQPELRVAITVDRPIVVKIVKASLDTRTTMKVKSETQTILDSINVKRVISILMQTRKTNLIQKTTSLVTMIALTTKLGRDLFQTLKLYLIWSEDIPCIEFQDQQINMKLHGFWTRNNLREVFYMTTLERAEKEFRRKHRFSPAIYEKANLRDCLPSHL
jgi:hypothetical protein